MFWACILLGKKGPFVFWEKGWGKMTMAKYSEHIIPIIVDTMKEHGGTFQQDNAPSHGRVPREILRENGIPVIDWPPRSPDLNPMEQCWDWMKNYIQEKIGDRIITSLDELRAIVEEAWEVAVTDEKIVREVSKLPQLLQYVIQAGGGHIDQYLHQRCTQIKYLTNI